MRIFLGKITVKQLLAHKRTCFIIFFSIAICVFALLLLTEEMFYSTDFLTKVDEEKRTYQLDYGVLMESVGDGEAYFVIDGGKSYRFVGEMVDNENLPVEKLMGICAYPNCMDEPYADYIRICGSQKRLDKTSFRIMDGRMFSDREMENGDNVIIINGDTVYGMYNKHVGDKVTIDGVSYEVIGITSEPAHYITYANAAKNSSYHLVVESVRFSHRLTEGQKKIWDELLALYDIRAETEYENSVSGYVHHVVRFLLIILGFMFFILLIIVKLFSYMTTEQGEVYTVYYKLGINPFIFAFMYYAPVMLLAAVGEAVGLCMYACSRRIKIYINMVNQLSYVTQFVVVVLVFSVVCMSVYPIYRRMGEDLCGR